MEKGKNQIRQPGVKLWHYFAVLLFFFIIQWFFSPVRNTVTLSYSEFKDSLQSNRIKTVLISKNKIKGEFREQKAISSSKGKNDIILPDVKEKRKPFFKRRAESNKRFEVIRVEDEKLITQLEEHNVDYSGKVNSNWLINLLGWIFPIIILILIWRFLFKRVSKGMEQGGQNIFNIGKNKAKLYALDEKKKVSFDDVAGVDEAKEELSEMIDFLKNPDKFTRLGAKLPKGVLLIGPPGTGKTLLARAIAGEAKVPFYSITGSDFVEMFVGVGAARVRDLFREAKSKSPCIVFIDEIDAIGKSRGQAVQMNANDERENTLNQLLSEMDGFAPGDAIILIGSTNRPEVLDRALLRPGRFDRQVLVDRPDLKGRVDILKVHTRDLILSDETELEKVAAQTPGFSGADLANICNEAALLASRSGKNAIGLEDFQEAIERVIAGLEKKNRLINAMERKIVAYHESGHAIVGHYTKGADPVQKVSIVPRGIGALGFTMQTPLEDRFLMTRSELKGKIKGMLGGRAAEEIIFKDVSTGASNDLERITRIAYDMVSVYGMCDDIPNISFKKENQNQLLDNAFQTDRRSEKIEQLIDDEVLKLIEECYKETKELLISNKDKLEKMANLLLEKEVLDETDVKKILD